MVARYASYAMRTPADERGPALVGVWPGGISRIWRTPRWLRMTSTVSAGRQHAQCPSVRLPVFSVCLPLADADAAGAACGLLLLGRYCLLCRRLGCPENKRHLRLGLMLDSR